MHIIFLGFHTLSFISGRTKYIILLTITIPTEELIFGCERTKRMLTLTFVIYGGIIALMISYYRFNLHKFLRQYIVQIMYFTHSSNKSTRTGQSMLIVNVCLYQQISIELWRHICSSIYIYQIPALIYGEA